MALVDPTSNEQKYGKLTSAAIIGATTSTTTRLWVRLYQEGSWSLVITSAPLTGDLKRLHNKPIEAFLKESGVKPVAVQTHQFSHQTSITHVFDVQGLKAGTRYYYAIISNELDEKVVGRRTELGGDQPKSFRTLADAPDRISFGFYSCHDHISANGDVGAWPQLLEKLQDGHADFVIGGGDQAYVDTNRKAGFLDIWEWLKANKKALLEQFTQAGGKYDEAGLQLYLLNIYRWYYRVYWAIPPLREVYEAFPQYMVWDDHEIMDGWGSLTNTERLGRISNLFEEKDTKGNRLLVNLMWNAACQAYFEYEHSHNPATPVDLANPDDCQWDYAFQHGDVAFYVLDMRGHHDVEKDKKQDPYILLGKAQFTRFTTWLASAGVKQAKAVFIVSPVPVVHWIDRLVNFADMGESKDDFMDEWGHESNHWERNALLEAVFKHADTSGKKIVFLSGDVHCASAFRLRHKSHPAAKVFQVTSSAISRKPAPGISKIGIASGGRMDGNDKVSFERLYAMAGYKNFAMFHVRLTDSADTTEVLVDLCWPGGEEHEVTHKRLNLT